MIWVHDENMKNYEKYMMEISSKFKTDIKLYRIAAITDFRIHCI